jgi:hypothetical protein
MTNELKVGINIGNVDSEVDKDAAYLKQGHGFGALRVNKGLFLPVNDTFWWFAPKTGSGTFFDVSFFDIW